MSTTVEFGSASDDLFDQEEGFDQNEGGANNASIKDQSSNEFPESQPDASARDRCPGEKSLTEVWSCDFSRP
jgi:hypothetical protein